MKSIPKGWMKTKLVDIATVQTGLSKSAARQGEFVSLPYLRVANVQDGYLDLSEVKYIDVPVAQQERFRLVHGDILLTEGGDFDKLGRGCLWTGEIKDCVHQNHVFAVRINDSARLTPSFLALLIQSDRSRTYFVSCAKQTTNLASINSSQLKQLPVLLPPLVEQQKLLRMIGEFSRGIDTATALILALERRKQGLMQQLLTGRRRLKGFEGKWKTARLGSMLERITRKNTTACLTPLTVSAQRGLVEQGSYFAKQIASVDNEHYLLLKRGEFAYNRSAAIGYPFGSIKRLDTFNEGIVSTLCLCFSVADDEKTDSDFLVGLIEAGLLNRELRAVAHEGARSHGLLNVTATDFFNIRVNLPLIDEQRAMAEVLCAADAEIALRREQLGQLKAQKRALMQKLLSGEWRLPEKAAQGKSLRTTGLQPPKPVRKQL